MSKETKKPRKRKSSSNTVEINIDPKKLISGNPMLVLGFIIAALVIGFIAARYFYKTDHSLNPVSQETTVDSVTLEEIITPASDLITMKYKYTDADVYENSKKAFGVKIPLTTDKVIFTYSGVVSAGIDLSQITYDIDNDKKTITVTLPKPKFLSHEMDESGFRFYDAKNSIFTETKLEDYTSLMAKLKSAKEVQLRNDGEFFPSVTENAKKVLNDLFKIADATSEYEIIYK
ncbi:DUF4230 domain-containing protein [Ruminococcus flavefaciens]|uniref:DUF4230 domain-containing protein n=1 Tax=Ruminococcus flavefaciens 007c TaxID=1341157 RepID=W7ULB0_RUMFL|nr:DUF4230 domain-containing protein [Ruminococcus flavefaciens]EWM54573.1 hypothetical protein RF007C_00410 [Ruminococcus flavefaciens 007c]